jgi:enoyl-CoA hydratase
MTDLVLRTDSDGLTTLTLNRPDKLNSLNVEVFEALDAHVDAIAGQTDSVGIVVLRGSGRCFSAGHDLGDIATGEKLPRPNFQSHVIEKLASLPQPVITAVHSHCYTGALELALAGDIILASENAKFGDTHAKWALTPVWGLSQRLPRRIGQSKAMEMMITCQTFSGREAEALGLANRCFADAEFEAGVEAFCRAALANSWFSHIANKALITSTDGLPLQAGLAREVYYGSGRGPDMEARIAAFANRKG